MFDCLLANLVNRSSIENQRAEGVAFFKVAKTLYGIESAEYLGVNLPLAAQHYAHCTYSDTRVRHYISDRPVCTSSMDKLRCDIVGWDPGEWPSEWDNNQGKQRAFTLPLRSRAGEMAVFGITVTSEWKEPKHLWLGELRVLANYFHSHILRINGQDFEHEMLISAKELDCLKWTAAGKTAWEASVILGISERTVRFHLNVAREKLNCANTTQAVAKAVAHQLIDLETG